MNLRKTKGKILILLTLLFVLMFSVAFFAVNAETTVKAAEIDSQSIFSFSKTSETECSVRLVDKTVTKAIIPMKGVIAGKEYSVTSIAANGFASATNLEKVRLPKTIKTIGQAAFSNCKTLKSMTLPAVESIGTNAFGMTQMDYIILPTTLTSVAPTILRNANTKVYVRSPLVDGATTPAGTWAANWNAYNTNQDVEYNSQYIPEVKYTYSSNTASRNSVSFFSSTPEGYIVDDYQEFCTTDANSPYQEVYIPAVHNGQPVIGIANSAFYYNTIEKITIGYAETPITIASYAFYGLEGSKVIINRDITLLDEGWGMGEMVTSEMVFASSMLSTIVLPNTITELGPYMFMDCYNLKDIHFRTPMAMTQTEEETLCDTLVSTQEVYLPETESFITIGDEAFSGAWGFDKLFIPSNVFNVGVKILGGWLNIEFGHKVYIDFASESALPVYDEVTNTGWNPGWDESCDVNVIEYNSIEEYNITYNLNGGTSTNPTVYTRKDHVILTDAVREGYVFLGWYGNPAFAGEEITQIALGTTGDLVFYARFENIIYTVTYEKNKPQDAINEIYGVTSNSQHIYDVSNTLTTNGYMLTGWKFICWKDANGNTYENGETILNLTSENNKTITLYAQWEAIEYNIIYNSNKPNNASTTMNGLMNPTNLTYEVETTLSNISYSLAGWQFVSWNTKADGTGISYANGAVVKNLTTVDNGTIILYAQWISNDYSVIYNGNKPVSSTNPLLGSMGNSTHTFDTPSNLNQNAYSISGWRFVNWNTRADGTGTSYVNGAEIKTLTIENNGIITLYAQWEANIYFVKYNANKPSTATNPISGIMGNSVHTYDLNSTLSPNQFSLVGWKFNGWMDSDGNTYTNLQPVVNLSIAQGDVFELYAQWEAIEYDINYNSNKPNNASTTMVGSMNPTRLTYDVETNLSNIYYSLGGWRFINWNTKANGTGTSYANEAVVKNLTTVDNGTIILYAQWISNDYSVIYNANKPVSSTNPLLGTMGNSTHKFDTPSNLTQNVYSIIGWRFVSWNTKADGTGTSYANEAEVNTLTTENNGIVTLYAQWQANTYSVRYNANQPNIVSNPVVGTMRNSTHTYDSDSTLSLNQFSLMGWKFNGWKDSNGNTYTNGEIISTLTPQSIVFEMYAQWVPINYSLTFIKNQPVGASYYITGAMSDSVHLYDYNKNISNNLYLLTGWHFQSWNTKADGSGTVYFNGQNIINLTADQGANIKLYAQWQANTYYVKYNANKPSTASGSMTGTMPNSTHIFDTQSTLRLNNFSTIGWKFDAWTDSDGNIYSDLNSISTLTNINNGTFELYAQWIPYRYAVEFIINKPSGASSSVNGTMDTIRHDYEELFNLANIGYSLTGWHFTNWNTKADGSGKSYSNGELVSNLSSVENAAVQLYAQWQANTYYIDYYSNVPRISSEVSGTVARTTMTYDSSDYLSFNSFSLVSWSFNRWLINGTYYNAGMQVKNLTTGNGTVLSAYAQWTEKSLANCMNSFNIYEIATLNQFINLRNYANNGWSFKLMDSFEVFYWAAITEFRGTLDLNGKTIKYTNEAIAYNTNYGFILENYGTIKNGIFVPQLKNLTGTGAPGALITIGGAVAINRGIVFKITVDSRIGQNADYMNANGTYVDINIISSWYSVGGVVGQNYGEVANCKNYASIGTEHSSIGGIVGLNFENAIIDLCYNYGDIWYNMSTYGGRHIGGIAGTVRDGGRLNKCTNYGTLTFALKLTTNQSDKTYIANIAASVCESAMLTSCYSIGKVVITEAASVYLSYEQSKAVKTNGDDIGYTFTVPGSGSGGENGGCVATGTLITLANGRQVPVETLTGNEMLLVWNMKTGTFDSAPILFIDSEDLKLNKVINLYFSDGTVVKVITEHGFWDITLNKYVFLREDATQFIGHWFNKQTTNENGTLTWSQVQLVNVNIEMEYTIAWSPVTYEHLSYYVNGMLSIPGATTGLVNIFEVDRETMQYDEAAMLADIESYGLFAYEEFNDILPVPQFIFEAFGGQYLKVSIGKGLIDLETLEKLIDSYKMFFTDLA